MPPEFKSLNKDVLSERITANILDMIRAGDLQPGDRLPSERELATMMKVSRPSLREALRALALMNIVEIRQGDGTYVSTLEPGLLVEHFDFVFSLTDATFLELFDAREVLEVGIVGLAAKRITDEELAAIRACMGRSKEVVDDPAAFIQCDLELHELITKAAGNSLLSSFMQAIRQLGAASRQRTARLPGVTRRSTLDHEAILKGLEARDPKAAQLAMQAHLCHVEQELEQLSADGQQQEHNYQRAFGRKREGDRP
jgi:GntR family transcriptional repressor for pyruvate dehydrogenase complex